MKRIAFFLIASTLGVLVVRAQQGKNALQAKFDALDSNKDGVLTANEVPAALFAQLDTDANGSVTPKEALQAVRGGLKAASASDEPAGPLATRLFKRFDKDNNDQLTREESGNAAWFDQLDRDKDGLVSLSETLAVAEKIKASVLKDGIPSAPAEEAKPISNGPPQLKAGEMGVGRQVTDVSFTDTDGKTYQLSALASKGNGVVIACTSTTCPVSKRYTPSLVRHAAELSKAGVALVLLNPLATDTPESLGLPYVHDKDHKVSDVLQPRTSTEVFYIDSKRTLIYRGALDDQYGVHYNLDSPRQRFLMDAIADHKAGRVPAVAATEAPGCELDLGQPKQTVASNLTYHGDISRILQQNCVECHHQDGLAPFALDDPDEVKDRAKTIRRVIEDGTMPPWFAKPVGEGKDSPWANERSLSTKDRTDLLAWINSSDRPMGNEADAPAKLVFNNEGWKHGTPDLMLSFAEAQPIKAEGKMPYVNVTVDTGLTDERWIQGYQVMPGDLGVVHHVLVFLLDPASKEKIREHESFFAAYVPGMGTEMFPAGFAKRIPPGSKLRFQMHYTPNGKATEDKTRIGFYYATAKPINEVKVASVANTRFAIPPGADNHEVVAQRTLPFDMNLMSFFPHMHVRGKAFRYEVTDASGTKVLLDVPKYDFNWQLNYRLKEPLHLPIGTVVRGVAHYDNSATNKANPDPTKTVRWGQQTDDEMMIGYVEYFVPIADKTTAGL